MTRHIDKATLEQLQNALRAIKKAYPRKQMKDGSIQGAHDGLNHHLSTQQPEENQTSCQQPSFDSQAQLHVLTIAINEYQCPTIRKLSGCVIDAEDLEAYVREYLRVPEENIARLRNQEATRDAIIASLSQLSRNPRIQENDPILIYFAGHGSQQTTAPEHGHLRKPQTQMLLSYDFGEQPDRSYVHGIPDYTLGALIKEVANAKGDNITVILDSCFSGSATRSLGKESLEPENTYIAREVAYEKPLPVDLDSSYGQPYARQFAETRSIVYASGFGCSNAKSHVLLSACAAGEKAYEANGRGVFTEALLRALRAVPVDKVTYTALLRRVGNLARQNPQCEGVQQSRFLFNAAVRGRNEAVYTGKLTNQNISINAGYAHGVTVESRFRIWRDYSSYMDSENHSGAFVQVEITQTFPFFSEAKILGPLGTVVWDSFVAEEIECGKKTDLLLHVPTSPLMKHVFEGIMRECVTPALRRMDIKLARDPTTAHFRMLRDSEDSTEISIYTNDAIVRSFGVDRLPWTISENADAIHWHKFVQGMAHFQHHLRRSNVAKTMIGDKTLSSMVEIEAHRRGGQVIRKHPAVNDDGHFNFVADRSKYIFKIRNDSNFDLYPALFFFDSCDLSITSLYESPTAGDNKVDPPLRRGTSLTVGYGGGTADPFQFQVRNKSSIEVGFFKLFLSTEHVDFSDIAQLSPFALDDVRGARPYVSRNNPTFWEEITVPVVVRKPIPGIRPAMSTIPDSDDSEDATTPISSTGPSTPENEAGFVYEVPSIADDDSRGITTFEKVPSQTEQLKMAQRILDGLDRRQDKGNAELSRLSERLAALLYS